MRAVWVLVLWTVVGCSSAPPAPEGVHDRKNRAADYLRFGKQAFQEAQYEQALSFYLIAVDLDTAVDYEVGMAVAWNSVATTQSALGNEEEARAALAQAEPLARAAGDRAVILQVEANLAQMDLASGRYDAVKARLLALQPFPATAEGAALDHAWGTLEKALDHPTEALAAFDRALGVNASLKLKQEMASNRFMKAAVLGRLTKWAEAKVELEGALGLDKTMENTLGIGQDLRALGTVETKLGRGPEGFDYYVRAHRLFQAAGLVDQQKKTLELLVPLAKALNREADATGYQSLLDRVTPRR